MENSPEAASYQAEQGAVKSKIKRELKAQTYSKQKERPRNDAKPTGYDTSGSLDSSWIVFTNSATNSGLSFPLRPSPRLAINRGRTLLAPTAYAWSIERTSLRTASFVPPSVGRSHFGSKFPCNVATWNEP